MELYKVYKSIIQRNPDPAPVKLVSCGDERAVKLYKEAVAEVGMSEIHSARGDRNYEFFF